MYLSSFLYGNRIGYLCLFLLTPNFQEHNWGLKQGFMYPSVSGSTDVKAFWNVQFFSFQTYYVMTYII
jgi:hypothetical protein